MSVRPRSSRRHSARLGVGAATGAIAVAALAMVSGSAGATTAPPADSAASEVDRTDWPETLTLAAVPSEESTALEQSYASIVTVLEEDLGVDVEFFQATDYAGVIEAMIAGDVDLAQFGPFSYVIAVQNGAEIAPVGAQVGGPDEEPGYVSYGIARGDNDEINSIEDFAGKNVCFVDPGSTSGFLYPSAGLLDAGIDPETGVNPVFAGGHDASVISVANGDCDAGFAFDAMVDVTLIQAGDIAEGDIKVVWRSETIAGSPMAMLTTLPQTMQDEITRVILEQANVDALVERGVCADVETCELSDEDGTWGFVAVDDSFYDGVRAVCETTQAEACAVLTRRTG